MFILSLCSNMLTLESIIDYIRQQFKKNKILKFAQFKISTWDEAFTWFFFFFSFFILGCNFILVFSTGMNSFRDKVSYRQKCSNSKKNFTIERVDFATGRVSSQDEISCVNTLLNDLEHSQKTP